MAAALTENTRLVILYFGPYNQLFEDLQRFPNVHFLPFSNPVGRRSTRAVLKFLQLLPDRARRRLRIDILDSKWCEAAPPRNHLTFVDAWPPPEFRNFLPQAVSVRQLFQPKRSIVRAVDDFFTNLRQRYEVVIGVHIRRGDYAQYKGGRYFFDDRVYQQAMYSLRRQLQAKQVAFVLCSNELVDPEAFHGLNCYRPPSPTIMHDLYALSACDYLFGPPSTYSMWASFMGRVPYAVLHHPGQQLRLQTFLPVQEKNRYEGGGTVPPFDRKDEWPE